MPAVEGTVLEVTGADMAANVAQIVFRLNEPNVTAPGIGAGNIYTTKERAVTPGVGGAFSTNLAATPNMHRNAWYDVGLRWNEGTGTEGRTFWDFGIKIQVPGGGPHNIGNLIAAGVDGGSGANQLLVWVDEIAPASPARGQWWFKPSTNDLYRWE